MRPTTRTLWINSTVGRRWVAALRSGTYRQTRKAMRAMIQREGDAAPVVHYCALGVLCAVEGIVEPHQHIISPHLTTQIVTRNDSLGASFAEIADYIESLLPPEEPEEPEVRLIVLAEEPALLPA